MNRDWSFTSKGLVNFFTVIGCAVAVIAVLGYLYVPCWKVRRVPGPPAFPLVGHIPLMARYGPEVFLVLSKRYGPIFRAPLKYEVSFGQTATDNHCRSGAVGIKKFKDISNRSIPSPIAASPLHQKGLFFTRDERWSTMRNTIISIYQPSHLASLVPIMQSIIESSTQKLESSKEEDITFSDLALTLATDTIGQAAFGVNFGLSSKSEPITDSSIGFVRYNQSTGDAVSDFISQHIYSTTQLKMDLSGSLSIVLGLVVPIIQEPFRQILKRIPGTMDWKVEKTNRKLSGRLDEIVSKRTEDLWKVSCYPIFGQIKILQILELRNAGRDTARETVPLKIKSSQHCKLAN